MSANKQTLAALLTERRALDDLFNGSQIDADVYRKGLVRLASEYMAVDEPYMAQQLLRGLNDDYIGSVLEVQMCEDMVFRQMVLALCESLVKGGWAYMGPEWNFKEPPANA